MLYFPQNINFSAITPQLVTRTKVEPSLSLRRIKSKIPGHMWAFTLKTAKLTSDEVRGLFGFISSLEGRFNAFEVVLPIYSNSRGNAISSRVKGNAAAGTKTVLVNQLPLNQINSFMVGDFVKFSNHTKVYQVAIDANSDGVGSATITLVAPLIEDVPASVNVDTKGVVFTVSLKRDVQKFTQKGGQLTQFSFDVEEDF